MKQLMMIAAIGLVALGGCDRGNHDKDAGHGVKISINSDDKDADAAWENDGGDGKGDGSGVKLALNLPGGFNAKINVPGATMGGGKFDIDGVGLYPGARVTSIDVDANASPKRSEVKIGFVAPGDAAAVADWYQAQFDAKDVKATRSGESFTGKSDDGDDFTLAIVAGSSGKSSGLLTITDVKKS